MTKEAVALHNAGFEVKVIYCPMSVWGDEFDKELFNTYPEIKWISVGAHPILKKFSFLLTRTRRKIWELFYRICGDRFNAALRASSLYSQDLEREAIQHGADLYIGHNLGSIKAVVLASQKHGGLASFDFEDYYSGCSTVGSLAFKLNKLIEDKYVKYIHFSTFASPLIFKKYQESYLLNDSIVLLNTFNSIQIKSRVTANSKDLELFWFSQNIGKERGIETIFEALSILQNENIKLTLLGNLSDSNRKYFEELRVQFKLSYDQVVFHGAAHPDCLGEIASGFHVGICSEESEILNVNLCLANKIFTYIIAGNALILSDTAAHVQFMKSNSGIGSIYERKNAKSLSLILYNYFVDRELLELHRINTIQLANDQLNWEIESRKLVDFYSNALSDN
jgi:glycosyltransferase involved in cell wall biosynthesis